MAVQHTTSLAQIPRILPVLSGKGGVGKSSVTVQLALALSLAGKNVGILDIDLTGPSIPHVLGVEGAKVRQAAGGWLPVTIHNRFELPHNPGTVSQSNVAAGKWMVGALYSMSLGFLLSSRGDAVIWRGPKKTAMVKQLLSDVLWPSDLDFLLIDTPPGTSDEHISMVTQLLSIGSDETSTADGQLAKARIEAVVVTTPQAISTADVRKELSFCAKVGLPVHGVIENMAGYVCPCCGEITNVFSKGGGEVMAREWGVSFLGSIPVDNGGWNACIEERLWPSYGILTVSGQDQVPDDGSSTSIEATVRDANAPLVERYTACAMCPIFQGIADHVTHSHGRLVQPPARQ